MLILYLSTLQKCSGVLCRITMYIDSYHLQIIILLTFLSYLYSLSFFLLSNVLWLDESGTLYASLSILRCVSSTPTVFIDFILRECWTCQRPLLQLLKLSCDLCPWVCLYNIFVGLYMLKHPWVSGMKLPLSWWSFWHVLEFSF